MFTVQDSLSPPPVRQEGIVMKTILLGDPDVGKTSLFWRIKEEMKYLESSSEFSVNTDMCTKRIITPSNGYVQVCSSKLSYA